MCGRRIWVKFFKPIHFALLLGMAGVNTGLFFSGEPLAQAGSSMPSSLSTRVDSARSQVQGSQVTEDELQSEEFLLVVTNASMEVNGDTSNPFTLIANPGPDGISLAEAMRSVSEYSDSLHEKITFALALKGATIDASQGGTCAILADGLTVDGDLDDDGLPDIILDGHGVESNGFWIWAASHILIEGMDIRNFNWSGIRITNNVIDSQYKEFGDIAIRNNNLVGRGHKGLVEIVLDNVHYGYIHDLEISGNTILHETSAIVIEATWGFNYSENEISHVSIVGNTVSGWITIRAAGGLDGFVTNSLVSDVVIAGNQINDSRILIDAANRSNCQNNTIRDFVIAGNQITSTGVGVEIIAVGINGGSSTGNRVENMFLSDNALIGGGIHIGGTTGFRAHDNSMSGILVDRNRIIDCTANGIYIIAGDGGAYNNLIEDVAIRNTLIANCGFGAGVLVHGDDYTSPNNTVRGVTISNMTLWKNGLGTVWAGGLNFNSKDSSNIISDVRIYNTILWKNYFEDAIHGSVAPDLVANSILNDIRYTGVDENFYLDPGFASPLTGDFRLLDSSPALDTGSLDVEIGLLDLDKLVRLWDGDQDSQAEVDRGAFEYGSVVPAELDVLGNQVLIMNGDSVPGYWDGTDFGTTIIEDEAKEHTFEVRNNGSLSLYLTGDPRVTISGPQAGDFVVTAQPHSPLSEGEQTTFIISFRPSQAGQRFAVVSIASNDGDEDPYTFTIKGSALYANTNLYLPAILR